MDAADSFLGRAKRSDPDRFRAVANRAPLLTEYQMAHRVRREIPVGDSNDLEIVRKHLRR